MIHKPNTENASTTKLQVMRRFNDDVCAFVSHCTLCVGSAAGEAPRCFSLVRRSARACTNICMKSSRA